MPTSKTSRQAPPRRFENYVLLKTSSPEFGLVDVNDRFMSTIIDGNVNNQTSEIQNIGFDFLFDGIVYKRFVADSNGWMALVDPTETSVANVISALFNGGYSPYQNDAINLSNSTQNVLICPWHDDLLTVSRDINSIPIALGTEKSRRITEGLETPPILYNQTQYGVKMFNDTSKLLGRRLVIRWSCLTNTGAMNTNLRFDVVIYENGRIEFRYAPRSNLKLLDVKDNGYYVEGATIGIFMPGTNRFRDFSPGLGQNDFKRLTSELGGAVYNDVFLDSSFDVATSGSLNIPYNWSLRPQAHWPGLHKEGTSFIFLPPVNKRKILPRIQQRIFDNQSSLPGAFNTGNRRNKSKRLQTLFDDRKTILYAGYGSSSYGSGTLVNYPSTLQRFYVGNHPSAINRQTLFAGDFNVTSSTSKIASDEFLNDDYQTTIDPWSEDKIFDNAPNSSIEPFFSASNFNALGLGLSNHLRAKTQIKMSLPINISTNMFAVSSSIYYYNTKIGCWVLPENSTSPIEIGASSVSANSKGDLSHPSVDTTRAALTEDNRGFTAIGNSIVSGTIERLNLTSTHTDPSIGALYSKDAVRTALSKEYRKSLSNNENYKASTNEVFRMPINHPFVIEKAIIEIPFSMGDGWFRDKTTCIIPHETGLNLRASYDLGGPGITIALFNQHKIGNFTRRDLIMSGTITHFDDNTSDMVFSSHPPYDHTCQLRPVGFKAFNGKPAAIITPITTSGGTFEYVGSVPAKLTAMTSNGVSVLIQRLMLNADKDLNRSGVLDLFNSEKIQLVNESATNFSQTIFQLQVNNFGRGQTGFNPSGRSIYGKEISSGQSIDLNNNVQNQFFLNRKTLSFNNLTPEMDAINRAQFGETILSGSDFISLSIVSLDDHQISPYLIYPEDELVLAISKTRPAFYGTETPSPHTSGSIVHDVVLLTGSINMTVYGSMLREGKEYHNTSGEILNTPAIFETVIGNDPILDQFEVEYVETYSSGSYDDYIAGSLLTRTLSSDGKVVLTPSRGRGRIFSKNSARFAPTPGAVDYDYQDSLAETYTKYSTKVGNLRLSQFDDQKERYYDTLMPAIDKCLDVNGVGICVQTLSSVPMGNPGFIYFNLPATSNSIAIGLMLLNDLNWTFSYPYEAKYSAVSRQQFFEKSFIATRIYDVVSGTPYYQIGPKYLKNFTPIIPMPRYTTNGGAATITTCVPNPGPNSPITTNSAWNGIPRDLDLLATSTKNLLSKSDIVKILYGFGDLNTVYFEQNSGLRGGTNHFADFRNFTQLSLGGNALHSPIIRGWKYGVINGLSQFTKSYFRQKRYGQFRDMLEQRQYTKFYISSEKFPFEDNLDENVTEAAVSVKFVDMDGNITNPANTSSQNLSLEATSSVPYFDGQIRNRTVLTPLTQNSRIISLSVDKFGQVTL